MLILIKRYGFPVYLRIMVRLFLGNRAGVLLLLPFLIGGYFALNNLTGYYLQEKTINLGLWGESIVLYPLISAIAASLIVFVNAVAINWIYNTNEFLERNSYLSSLLYIVLMSFYHSFYSVDGLLLAHTFLILTMAQFFKLSQQKDGRKHIFNGMLFAGVAATFHPPLIALFPFLCIMFWVLRPFIFREFILGAIAFGIPLVYSMVYLWYSGHEIDLKLLDQLTDYRNKQTDFLVTALLFTLLSILSVFSIRSRMQKSSIRLKKLTSIIWWYLFIALVLGVADFIMFRQIERFSFMMIALSVFLTFSFTNKTFSIIATTLFYLTLGYSFTKFFF
jgi:hypothetical protein